MWEPTVRLKQLTSTMTQHLTLSSYFPNYAASLISLTFGTFNV